MRIEWQIAFWLLMLALVGFGVYLFANVLTPFVAALALGYVLDPIAGRLQKLGMSRVFATLIILAFFVLLLLIFIFGVAPILGRQLVGLAESLPDYVAKLQSLFSEQAAVLMQKYGGAWLDKFGLETAPSADSIQKSLGNFVGQGAHMDRQFHEIAVVGRAGAGRRRYPDGHHAGGDLLSAAVLAGNGQRHPQPDPAAPSRHRL